jgi:hypothetical protein
MANFGLNFINSLFPEIILAEFYLIIDILTCLVMISLKGKKGKTFYLSLLKTASLAVGGEPTLREIP